MSIVDDLEGLDLQERALVRGAQRVFAVRGGAGLTQEQRRILAKIGINPVTGHREPFFDPARPNQKVYPQLTKAEARAALARRGGR